MKTIETTARTTEEAIEIALKELDADRGEVEIDVVSRGKTGILGIGGEPACVRVTRLEGSSDEVRVTTEVLRTLISRLGVSVVVNLKQAHGEDLGGPVYDIEGEDSGLLIGRRGDTLKALQFLVRIIVSRLLGTRVNIMLDIEGYQERRFRSLRNLAWSVAQRVVTSGRAITLEPMPANERRIAHLTLADHPQVITQSVGADQDRRVVVQLKDQ